MKSFKQHLEEASEIRTADAKRVKVRKPDGSFGWRKQKQTVNVERGPVEEAKKIDLAGVELIMGATKNSAQAEKEVAKAYKISSAEAKKLVQQVINKASKGRR